MQAQRDYVMCQRSHKPVNGKARFEFRSPAPMTNSFYFLGCLSFENVIIRVKKKFFQNRKPESTLTEKKRGEWRRHKVGKDGLR